MRRVFGITLLLALSSAISFAADATFSKDGKRVYAIQFETSKLIASKFGLVPGEARRVDYLSD